MKTITGGVCAPKGFMAGGIRCGIKQGLQKNDLALIYSKEFCSAAAVFTENKVKAASVLVSQENIANGKLRAVIANSGNANACTGKHGMDAARRMAHLIADELSIAPSEAVVASTGVIGVPLPIEAIEKNISALKASLRSDEAGHTAALEAIMTTDTRKKDIAVEVEIDGKIVRIGAMAKGSGMIHPNMATMLCFITTDAAITPSALDCALRYAVNHSFNRLTVDGDTSTNDMAVIMANGEAENNPVIGYQGSGIKNRGYEIFCRALEHVCVELTRMMARDGEGATKLITVTVSGAQSEEKAVLLAKSAASSSLVKTACFGADANWGRVLCAMGYSGADFDPSKVSVGFRSSAGEIQVCSEGQTVNFSEERAKEILSREEIEILIGLSEGNYKVSVWSCDLSYDYIKINGDYRS
ncbi:MAG: bifunctional glutamate N-acetyltransferase/amino-acid acetyltransferase ArgJ [Treponema sp.]|nr:bifunctional glutamate N-acetyltransferase/amino-acid acetyltransferase ArgJ [Treponema sp.]